MLIMHRCLYGKRVIVSALDNFEVTEVPLETFKKMVKEEVEAI